MQTLIYNSKLYATMFDSKESEWRFATGIKKYFFLTITQAK